MKKSTLTLFWILVAITLSPAQLVISEIMYNPPESGADSLEFIEIHNPTATAINVEDYVLAFSIATDTLSGTIDAGGFYVSAVRASAFETAYGVPPNSVWSSSRLNNNGTTITLNDASGANIASISYDNSAPWPRTPNGDGPSLEICNLTLPDDGNSWQASMTSTGFMVNGTEVLASPFALPMCAAGPSPPTFPIRTIGEMLNINSTGGLDSIGATATLIGTVNSIDFDGGQGIEFYMQDGTDGIRIVNPQDIFRTALGDVVSVRGTLEQRDGSAQFSADSVRLMSTTTQVVPQVVTDITEGIQGTLVVLENFTLVDPSEWQTSGSFDVEVSNGTVTTTLHIDEDTDFEGMNEPTGTFDITGIANQVDPSSPFDEGYQILPRFTTDISPYVPGSGPSFPLREIDEINNVDPVTGISDSLGKLVTVEGVVLGFNLRSPGIQFTIVDPDGNGIGVFNFLDNLGYTVVQGDRITVRGQVDQFNGLTQIVADEILFVNADNSIPSAVSVYELDEFSESRLVILFGLVIVDPNEWLADPTVSYNVRFVNSDLDTVVIRISSGSSIGNMPAPQVGESNAFRGIGGQFDRDAPFLGDYQLFPRDSTDVGFVSSNTTEIKPSELFTVLPQGGGWQLYIKQALELLELRDVSGRIVSRLTDVQAGTVFFNKPTASAYILTATTTDNKRGSLVLTR